MAIAIAGSSSAKAISRRCTVIMIALCTGELNVQVTKDLLREGGIKWSNDIPAHNQFFTRWISKKPSAISEQTQRT